MAHKPSSLFPAYVASSTTRQESAEEERESLFPAYGRERSQLCPPSQGETKEPEWLRNESFDPSISQLESCCSSFTRTQVESASPERQSIPEDQFDDKTCHDESSTAREEAFIEATKRKRKGSKKKKSKVQEDKPLPRKFRFLTGFGAEERFFVDRRPDRAQLAFDTLPHTLSAVYQGGWRCDDVPALFRCEPRKTLRYWHRKARQVKCVASVARPKTGFSASRRWPGFVPVVSAPTDGDASDVDPLEVRCTSVVNYTQGGANVEAEAGAAAEVHLPLGAVLLCPEASKKQRELKERLERTPASERAWLDLVAFQDEYVSAMEEASGIQRTHGRARAIREKKLAVLEQALLRTHGSVSLHLLKIQVLLECGEEAQASRAWAELLRVHPGNARLWLEHARFLQAETTLSGFELSAAAAAYLRAIATFRDMIEGRRATQRSPLEVERRIVEVLSQYCIFLCQCGLWERAVATYQALLELNLRAPARLEPQLPLDQWLALLEPFWDSGAPRFGEVGSVGWAHTLEAKEVHRSGDTTSKFDESVEKEEEAIVNAHHGLCETWLRLESLRDLCHWTPFRPDLGAAESDDAACEDPERMVLFEDVAPALFRLRDPSSKFSLLRTFFDLLVGPELSPSESGLVRADCFERLPGTDLDTALRLSDILAFPAGWEVRRGLPDFAEEVLKQSEGLFESEELRCETGRLRMRLARRSMDWSPKRRKKAAKSVLSEHEHERDLDLWTEYGLLLIDLGSLKEATSVYERALDMVCTPGVLSVCQCDYWQLLAEYLDLLLGVHGWWKDSSGPKSSAESKEKVLKALSWIKTDRRFSCLLSNNLSPPMLLRAAAACEEMLSTGNQALGLLRVSLWTVYFVSGFEAASALAEGRIAKVKSKPEESGCSLEELHEAYLRVCAYHVGPGGCPSRRPLVLELRRAVQDVPHSARLLWCLVSLENGALGALRVRRLLEELHRDRRSPVAWIVGLCFELERSRLLDACRAPGAPFSTPQCGNLVRRVLERTLESVSHRRCPLLWRLYIEMEVRYGTKDSAKATFYRALQSCPWAKVLYLDGVRNFPECLQEVADMILEKGLRLRAPLEEVQLLRDHAGKNDPDKEGGARSPREGAPDCSLEQGRLSKELSPK